MMHRCSSSHGNMVGGPCSCGTFNCQSSSFSMLFSMPNHHHKSFEHEVTDMCYPFTSPSSSSSVDCTLSLGTPSTRLCEGDEKRIRQLDHQRSRSNSSCMSNLCWDMLQPKNTATTTKSTSRSGNSNNGNSNNNMANSDPLLARRCANCDTTSTPLWRNGPRGPKSLCNACGIRFKKEERRATAANANANATGGAMEQQQQQHYGYHHQNNNSSWVQTTQKMACFSPAANEFRFISEDSDDRDSDHTGIPNFLSWRLNVTDRPTQLVHDFTRY